MVGLHFVDSTPPPWAFRISMPSLRTTPSLSLNLSLTICRSRR